MSQSLECWNITGEDRARLLGAAEVLMQLGEGDVGLAVARAFVMLHGADPARVLVAFGAAADVTLDARGGKLRLEICREKGVIIVYAHGALGPSSTFGEP